MAVNLANQVGFPHAAMLRDYHHSHNNAREEAGEPVPHKSCCGVPLKYLSFGVVLVELVVSLSCTAYTVFGLFHLQDYNPESLLHDALFLEARKHYPGKMSHIPPGLLYADLSLFFIEFLLALVLTHGLVKNKVRRIRFWMTSMMTYNVVLTGIFLGFIVGGISSTRLNIIGFFHGFLRFLELAIIYTHYESLKHLRRLDRLEKDNNNTVVVDVSQLAYLTTNNEGDAVRILTHSS